MEKMSVDEISLFTDETLTVVWDKFAGRMHLYPNVVWS